MYQFISDIIYYLSEKITMKDYLYYQRMVLIDINTNINNTSYRFADISDINSAL